MANDAVKGPDWECVNEAAPWQARDSHGKAIFQDHIWIFGGWFTPHVPNPRDVWKSPDGRQWTCTVEEAPWIHGDLMATMAYRDRLWVMGGRRLPGKENSNKVWSSPDGATWTLVGQAPWCPRVGHAYAVFKDRMWVIGGTENFYEDNDQTLKNDVWSTEDGVAWRLETEDAGWPKRRDAQVVVFRDKLWLMGGGSWNPVNVPRNDVWCSEDGVRWTQVTEAAEWPPRIWHSVVAYRDRLWVMAGWSRANGNFGDVWYSQDGKAWTRMESDVIWQNRHAQTAYVFKDRIWVVGGYADVLDSQVWTLQVPEGGFRGR